LTADYLVLAGRHFLVNYFNSINIIICTAAAAQQGNRVHGTIEAQAVDAHIVERASLCQRSSSNFILVTKL